MVTMATKPGTELDAAEQDGRPRSPQRHMDIMDNAEAPKDSAITTSSASPIASTMPTDCASPTCMSATPTANAKPLAGCGTPATDCPSTSDSTSDVSDRTNTPPVTVPAGAVCATTDGRGGLGDRGPCCFQSPAVADVSSTGATEQDSAITTSSASPIASTMPTDCASPTCMSATPTANAKPLAGCDTPATDCPSTSDSTSDVSDRTNTPPVTVPAGAVCATTDGRGGLEDRGPCCFQSPAVADVSSTGATEQDSAITTSSASPIASTMPTDCASPTCMSATPTANAKPLAGCGTPATDCPSTSDSTSDVSDRINTPPVTVPAGAVCATTDGRGDLEDRGPCCFQSPAVADVSSTSATEQDGKEMTEEPVVPQQEKPSHSHVSRKGHPEKHKQEGHTVSQTEGRIRRISYGVIINTERLKHAKLLAEKSIKQKKIFTVHGPYPVIRSALRSRGWVEKKFPKVPKPAHRKDKPADEEMEDADGDDSADYDDDDAAEEDERDEDPDGTYDLLSRLVRNEMPYFIWTTRRDSYDCRFLKKEQMMNHYARAGSFTTKVGLCLNLRNLHWFDVADPDTFFPRCYRLGATDEKRAFIEDFWLTAARGILKRVVKQVWKVESPAQNGTEGDSTPNTKPPNATLPKERNVKNVTDKSDLFPPRSPAHGEPWERTSVTPEGSKITLTQCECLGSKRTNKKKAGGRVPGRLIETALQACERYLNSLEHNDIDSEASSSAMTNTDWEEFLHNYYRVIHDGAILDQADYYATQCEYVLEQLEAVNPQLNIEGERNIWIIKPGAKSRGRGIICMDRLEEMLKLVDGDAMIVKDGKWVVQKYIERPLLLFGTKFDLRQWFLVTDWNPLTIWFYRESYIRFSTQPFSLENLDTSIHLCNNSIQKHFENSMRRHPQVPADNMWSSEQFRAYLQEQESRDVWTEVIVPGMKAAVIYAMQTAQDVVEFRKNSFELYGADFMFGENFHPWLIEINASPTMAPSTVVTTRLCGSVQEDTLRVVIDRKQDRNCDIGGFELIFKQPAVNVPQYVGINLMVEGLTVRKPHALCQRHAVGQGVAMGSMRTRRYSYKASAAYTTAMTGPQHNNKHASAAPLSSSPPFGKSALVMRDHRPIPRVKTAAPGKENKAKFESEPKSPAETMDHLRHAGKVVSQRREEKTLPHGTAVFKGEILGPPRLRMLTAPKLTQRSHMEKPPKLKLSQAPSEACCLGVRFASLDTGDFQVLKKARCTALPEIPKMPCLYCKGGRSMTNLHQQCTCSKQGVHASKTPRLQWPKGVSLIKYQDEHGPLAARGTALLLSLQL